jgi:hypothetical protein
MSDWQNELAEIWEAIVSGVEKLSAEVQEASEELSEFVFDVAEKLTSDLGQ